MRTKIAARAMVCAVTLCMSVAGVAESFDDLRGYDYGQSRAPLLAVEAAIRAAGGAAETLAGIEQQLVEIIQGDCTPACRQFCCEQLAVIGTARAVPALAALLQDAATAPMAIYALEEIPEPEATQALLDALSREHGPARLALVNALGVRGDALAAPALIPLLADADTAIALASAHALGLLGDVAAIEALGTALAEPAIGRHPSLVAAFESACVLGADRLLAKGDTAQAQPVFEQYFWSAHDPATREAALCGYIRSSGDFAMTIVTELLWGNVPGMEHVAIPFVRDLPGGGGAAPYLANMQPAVQAMVIDALAERGDASVLPYITACFDRPEFSGEAVLAAATRAVGRLGGGESVGVLLNSGAAHPAIRETAVAALSALRGDAVNAVLHGALDGSEDDVRAVMVIRALANRRATALAPVLVERARVTDGAQRQAALEALAVLAGPGEVSSLLTLALTLRSDARDLAGNAIVAAAGGKADAVLALLPNTAGASDRAFLMGLLSRIGDDAAIEPLRSMLDDAPEALGVLANWPTGAAVPALAEVFAREQGDRRQEALAGLMRGLAKPDPRPVDETLALFGRLLATASTGQEYTEIFAALARVGDARALDLVTPFLSGRGIDAEAAMALDAVRRGLYRASASHKSGAAANAIDGIPETRWDTGAAQLGAEWFVLDLGLPYTIRAVTLDTTPSPVSYPGAVALFLSEDGQTWGEALAEQEGSEKVTLTIAPQRARYIKVSQTGRREAQLWSIHELTVDAVTGE